MVIERTKLWLPGEMTPKRKKPVSQATNHPDLCIGPPTLCSTQMYYELLSFISIPVFLCDESDAQQSSLLLDKTMTLGMFFVD